MAARPVSSAGSGISADAWRDRALVAERGGDRNEALRQMEQALAAHPAHAALANSAGNVAMRAEDFGKAERWFGQAAALEPGSLDYALNTAIALSRLEKFDTALVFLEPHAGAGKTIARYCSARGNAERGAGNLAEAEKWYDCCLALDQKHVRALHGRARLALERGETDALQRFDAAIAVNQGDADLWLGKAQALDVEGRPEEARQIAQALVEQAPQWEHGTRFLAQLRLAAGEEDYTSHYTDAARKVPQDPNIRADHAELLAGLDRFEEAADVLAGARRDFPDSERFTLMEAVQASAAGDDDRAEGLFADYSVQNGERKMHEARHRIRRGEYDRALPLLDDAIAENPGDIGAWAIRGFAWRLTDDPRSDWLHEQAGLVQFLPLVDDGQVLARAAPLLHHLHDNSPLPLGQSLRGGSQTRGILFARRELELAALHDSLTRTLESYRAGLPDADADHPLLRHRDTAWSLAGSWSVRLSGGGDFHTSHIHPQGIISSALYCEVPAANPDDPLAGALEVGRPPPDLRLDLPPLKTITPKPGHLALFPSTLHHGTRSFTAERRMTVAFDVVPQDEAGL